MKNTIIKRYTREVELSEIDFDLYQREIGDEYDGYLTEIKVYCQKSTWSEESYPINIDKVIEVLSNLKKDGANYVEIMYHCDHIEYVFNGVEVRKATKIEIEEDKKIKDSIYYKKKQDEIESLERKLKQLRSDIN